MATIDDSVRNLERFVGLLTVATGELERIAKDVAATGDDLTRIEDEADEHGTALNDRLEEMRSALVSGENEAKESLEDLRDAGGDADEGLRTAVTQLEEAVAEAEEGVQDAETTVEDGHQRLLEQGFEAVGRALDGLETEMETARAETASHTAELTAAVEALESEAEAAWDGAQTAVETAEAESAALAASLETRAAEAVAELESEAGEIETACTSLAGELTTIYELVVDAADAQQGAMVEGLQGATQEASGAVAASEEAHLRQPARAAEQEALVPLAGELAQLAETLAGATRLLDALPPLAIDLTACEAVVAKIDELLQAMAG